MCKSSHFQFSGIDSTASSSMPAPRVLELDTGKSEKKVWLVKVRSKSDGRPKALVWQLLVDVIRWMNLLQHEV
jgi:hypothetical protein